MVIGVIEKRGQIVVRRIPNYFFKKSSAVSLSISSVFATFIIVEKLKTLDHIMLVRLRIFGLVSSLASALLLNGRWHRFVSKNGSYSFRGTLARST